MRGRPPEDDRPASSRRNDLEEKGGRGLQKAVMQPEPRENPAQNDHPDYQESPWAFIIKMEPLKN